MLLLHHVKLCSHDAPEIPAVTAAPTQGIALTDQKHCGDCTCTACEEDAVAGTDAVCNVLLLC